MVVEMVFIVLFFLFFSFVMSVQRWGNLVDYLLGDCMFMIVFFVFMVLFGFIRFIVVEVMVLVIGVFLFEYSLLVYSVYVIWYFLVVFLLKLWMLVLMVNELLVYVLFRLGIIMRLCICIFGVEQRVMVWKIFGKWNIFCVLRNELFELWYILVVMVFFFFCRQGVILKLVVLCEFFEKFMYWLLIQRQKKEFILLKLINIL